jgi:arylsulfatase A-like enzyme
MIKRKYIALMLVLFSIFAVAAGCRKERKLKDYNVVVIVIDTLRSDHLPFYGYKKNTAPFLWELSKKSVVFENAFSASSWTSPGTASIFTSLYPYQHGVLMGLLAIQMAKKIHPDVKVNRIPEEIKTMPEVLKEAGYRTYGISDNLNIGKLQGFTQGFDKFRTFMYRRAPTVNNTAKKWLSQLKGKGKYFLYIQYMDPHAPYHQREPWYEPHEDKIKSRISAYDSEINYVDQHFKELFELYEWDKNTLLIITSDHGEGLWDHGHMAHGKTLYREEIQVPLMIYLPGGTKTGWVNTNVSTIDILPTIRDIIGLPRDKNDEGVSLVPLIENKKHDLDKRDLFSYLWVQSKTSYEWKTTIYKKWHFALELPETRYLFSLLLDQKERENKFKQAADIASQLEKRFDDFMKKSKKYTQKSAKYKLDKKKTDKLKTLGYVN